MWHYLEKGHGQPIVFLHGFPDFSYLWREQINCFSNNYHVIAPDLPGFHLSLKLLNLEDYQLNNLVKSLYEFIQSLKLHYQKIILVGHDWGGLLAWALAMQYPELLEKLIVINAPHPNVFAKLLAENPKQQKAAAYIKLFLHDNAARLLKANDFSGLKLAFIKTGLQEGWITENDVAQYEHAWSQDTALECMLNYYKASFQIKDSKLVFIQNVESKIITVPTTVIWGINDTYLIEENLNGLGQVVNDLDIIKVNDADHWLIHKNPDRLNQLIQNVLHN